MDDARIRQLTEEVLAEVRGARDSSDLESRVAALEVAVRALGAGAPPAAATIAVVQAHSHPSGHLVSLGGGGSRCLLEPDKPCVQSGQCRTLGH